MFLMKGKVYKNGSGFHRFYISCPRTIWIAVRNKFIVEAERPSYGRGENEIF